jgi:hypothetical protein
VVNVDYISLLKKQWKRTWGLFKNLANHLIFWVFFCGTVVLVFGWLTWRKFHDRLSTDVSFARRMFALKGAKRNLKEAKKALNSGESKEFYAAIFKAINNYITDKTARPLGSLTAPQIIEILKEKNAAQSTVESVQSLLSVCDLARFASAGRDKAQMEQDLAQTQALISEFETRGIP